MTHQDYLNIINKSERYSDFTICDKPIPFSEMFKNKDFEIVQIFCITQDKPGSLFDIGFAGQFAWNNNKITSLDGDSYNENTKVYAYKPFVNKEENITTGLDIVIGDDW